MRLTARELQRLAASTGFELASLEKVYRLAELLVEIGRHPLLKEALVLKGGTALNLFFGPPSRLSVDLDFNYVGAVERERMLAERPEVERGLEVIAQSLGYGLQRSAEAHAGTTLHLSFRGVDDQRARIEVDVNFLHRLCLLPPEERTLRLPGGEAGPRFRLLSWPEIVAGKVTALLDRAAPRDLWDVARLPEISPEPWPSEEVRAIFVALAGTLPRALVAYVARGILELEERDVRRLLHPLLTGGERPSAGELARAARTSLEPLFRLKPPEAEYSVRLQSGELAPELLFPSDPDLAARVRRHPALVWKADNARDFTAGRRRPPRP